jgi:transposase-like protein
MQRAMQAMEGEMNYDFVYCPGCARYSIVTFKPELRGWECEDCTYTQPMDEELAEATHAGLAS